MRSNYDRISITLPEALASECSVALFKVDLATLMD
jgi:hypothetical protein